MGREIESTVVGFFNRVCCSKTNVSYLHPSIAGEEEQFGDFIIIHTASWGNLYFGVGEAAGNHLIVSKLLRRLDIFCGPP